MTRWTAAVRPFSGTVWMDAAAWNDAAVWRDGIETPAPAPSSVAWVESATFLFENGIWRDDPDWNDAQPWSDGATWSAA